MAWDAVPKPMVEYIDPDFFFNLTNIKRGAVSKTLKTMISCLKTAMSYERADHVQKCRCWLPAVSHGMQGRDAVAP